MGQTGKNLRMYREKAGLTQEELARLVRYSDKAMIAQIEAGVKSPSLEKAQDLAVQLGITLSQLVGEVAPPTTVTNNANGDHQTVYQHVEGAMLSEEMEQSLSDSLKAHLEVHRQELARLFDVTVVAEALRLAVREGMREALLGPDGPRPTPTPSGRPLGV